MKDVHNFYIKVLKYKKKYLSDEFLQLSAKAQVAFMETIMDLACLDKGDINLQTQGGAELFKQVFNEEDRGCTYNELVKYMNLKTEMKENSSLLENLGIKEEGAIWLSD